MSESRLEPGVVLSGHLLSEEIGAGGFARVFRATPVAGGDAIALKVAVRPELVAALRTEGAVLRRLQGPRFVKILEEHLEDDPPFFVLELCTGGDLRRLLDAEPERRLVPERALDLFAKIVEGVALAHEEGVVHGDLKPENVLLDGSGEPKLADFGLSREQRTRLVAKGLQESLATEEKRVRGTFDYLAPEVRRGQSVTPSADVFALGVLLYEMLVGRRPLGLFEPPSAVLASAGVGLPIEVDGVVARALAADPRDRFLDAGELLRALKGESAAPKTAKMDGPHQTLENPLAERVARGVSWDFSIFLVIAITPFLLDLFAFLPTLPNGPRDNPSIHPTPAEWLEIAVVLIPGVAVFFLGLSWTINRLLRFAVRRSLAEARAEEGP